jgi:dienelactone hydrolase
MALRTQELVYESDGTRLVGELAWDDAHSEPRPGIVVFPEGGGINEHPKQRAAQLTELGYVALACDMYGNGEFSSVAARRSEMLGALRAAPEKLRARAQAGLAALAAQPQVDATRLGAMGFCFGGLVSLELARTGAALRGAVSFHGILETRQPAQAGVLQAKLLVLHGADDPFVPPEQIAKFIGEMKAAGADWQLVHYGGAVHGFTRSDADSLGMPGVGYDRNAERRSFAAMRAFFAEVFTDEVG